MLELEIETPNEKSYQELVDRRNRRAQVSSKIWVGGQKWTEENAYIV